MKWSEQMRVLNSEDEHYNQLMFDVTEEQLFINDRAICFSEASESGSDSILHYMPYGYIEECFKKYSFFTDEKFLLNCMFKDYDDVEGRKRFARATAINYYDGYIEIVSDGFYLDGKKEVLVIYTKSMV